MSADRPQFDDLSGATGPENPILDEIADLLARHKLVPFFGAGMSRQQLGFAAAELAQDIAPLVNRPPETPLSQLADDFADQYGEPRFLNYLKSKLVLTEVDDAKVPAHRLLLSLSLNLLYTTNQDNIFELVSRTYGRRYRRIVTLSDLSDADPGEPCLIKFHGDLDAPDSLVFGNRSYQQRMSAEDHPLDIKLRADLLGKRLLFIGYSLQDENINKLILSVRRAANGLPPSYLLAFDYDPSMEDLSRTYGVRVINPRQIYPAATSNDESFERCLKDLCDRTIRLQAQRGLEALVADEEINARMATGYEVEAVGEAAETAPFEAAVSAFRGAFDWAIIPTSLQRRVVDIFRRLVARVNADNDEEMSDLKNALLNLHLPPAFAIEALANLMAACNRRSVRDGFDDFISLPCPALPDGLHPVAAAWAVTLVAEQGEVVTDNFRRLAVYWFEGFQEAEPQHQELISAAFEIAWPGHKASESPLHRPRLPFRSRGFHSLLDEIQGRFPKKFLSPKE